MKIKPLADAVSSTVPTLDQAQHPSLGSEASSSIVIWDWHSSIILVLLAGIGYHFWVFRSLYIHVGREMARSLRNRVFDADISVDLRISTYNDCETTTVVLTGSDVSEPLGLVHLAGGAADLGVESIATVEISEILEEDDHFHDCL